MCLPFDQTSQDLPVQAVRAQDLSLQFPGFMGELALLSYGKQFEIETGGSLSQGRTAT